MDSLTIRKPDDWHVHLRRDEILGFVTPYTARVFARALVMPNTIPPVLTSDDAWNYGHEISKVVEVARAKMTPLMTIKLTDNTTPDMIYDARDKGIVACKLYPVGVTTNSSDGVSRIFNLDRVFRAIDEAGLVLCVHCESVDAPILQREAYFLKVILDIAKKYRSMRIVIEHVSDGQTIYTLNRLNLPNVGATITAHHLVLTLDDVIGSRMQPHNFCLPVAKNESDRLTLVHAAISGNPRYFFGSDSAPHLRKFKEYSNVFGGIFSAPVALPILADVFEKAGALDKLEDFTSRFGAEFYQVPLNEGKIDLIKNQWKVPTMPFDIVPFKAGEMLNWQVENN